MENITGIMFYYYFVCRRKLWYFTNQISMEQDNENVAIGKSLDENTYQNEEKHINLDNVVNIDYIKSTGIIHEIKKSKNIEQATIWQVKYYLYYLKRNGVDKLKGKIDYPLLKQSLDVELTPEDEQQINKICEDIYSIHSMPKPPEMDKKSICKNCAYFDLCFI